MKGENFHREKFRKYSRKLFENMNQMQKNNIFAKKNEIKASVEGFNCFPDSNIFQYPVLANSLFSKYHLLFYYLILHVNSRSV